MFHLLTNKKLLLSFAIATLILFIISLVVRPATPTPTLLSTSPTDNAVGVSYLEPLKLTFDAPIDPTLLSITSIPEESWRVTSSIKNVVDIKSEEYLLVNTQYTVNINYNQKLLKTLTFTTIPQQSEPRANKAVVDEIQRDYPLANKVPYQAPGFTVLYKSPHTLEITLKEGVEERSEIINAVRDWVKESGLDPDSHTYVFSN